jgi:hypothetical protein
MGHNFLTLTVYGFQTKSFWNKDQTIIKKTWLWRITNGLELFFRCLMSLISVTHLKHPWTFSDKNRRKIKNIKICVLQKRLSTSFWKCCSCKKQAIFLTNLPLCPWPPHHIQTACLLLTSPKKENHTSWSFTWLSFLCFFFFEHYPQPARFLTLFKLFCTATIDTIYADFKNPQTLSSNTNHILTIFVYKE